MYVQLVIWYLIKYFHFLLFSNRPRQFIDFLHRILFKATKYTQFLQLVRIRIGHSLLFT